MAESGQELCLANVEGWPRTTSPRSKTPYSTHVCHCSEIGKIIGIYQVESAERFMITEQKPRIIFGPMMVTGAFRLV